MLLLNKLLTTSQIKSLKYLWIFHNFLVSRVEYDIIVIGGGIIGTAIAKTLKEKLHHTKLSILEKEHHLAHHQSSHNSNIIHSGIYYEPNSLKAKLCVKGANLIYDYCTVKNIPTKRNGKLVIALNVLDTYRLNELYKRGLKNKVPGLTILKNWKDVLEIQPSCKGVQALWSPNTGTVDWKIVTEHFADDFKREGGDIFLNCEVKSIKNSAKSSHPLVVEDKLGKCFFAKYVVTCLGLYSGSLLEREKCKNISFKIRYKLLNRNLCRFVKTNIYAMPDIDLPFIGMHFSPMLDGNVLLGPSAIPALKLDSYGEDEIDLDYIQRRIFSQEFARFFLNNFRTCFDQFTQTVFGEVQSNHLKKYFPMISKNDILPGPEAVQGQILKSDGEFVDDFLLQVFQGSGLRKRIVDCRFIPSPGATSSLAIARLISEEMSKHSEFCCC